MVIIFLLFGFMLATQLRARPPVSREVTYQRADQLAILLKATEEERDRLKEEVKALRDKVAEMMAGESQAKVMQEELYKARILGGLVDVTGPGVSVEMTDSQKQAAAGQDPNVFLIHDDDVLRVVNELRAAGAEAIAVNGQRLVSTSEIRCAGPVFIINGVRVAPPIKIQAIGDPEMLQNALKMRGGVIDTLALWGIEVKIKVEQSVTVPAYTGSLTYRFAKPVAQGEAK